MGARPASHLIATQADALRAGLADVHPIPDRLDAGYAAGGKLGGEHLGGILSHARMAHGYARTRPGYLEGGHG
jgi:hypothetical protein